MARKIPLALGLILLCSLTISGARKPQLNVSFHLQGEEYEGGKFVQPMRLGSPPQTYYFRKAPSLTQRHIVGYYPFQSNDGSSWGSAFKLNDNGTSTLSTISAAGRGRKLLTVINGEPVDFVVLDRTITDGYIVVWGGLTEKDLALFDKQFKRIPRSDGGGERRPITDRATSREEEPLPPLKISEEDAPKKRKLLPFRRKKKE